MAEAFFEDFANSVRADFEKALNTADADEGILTIVQSIAGYFAGNEYALTFALINIYERNLDGNTIAQRIKEHGADMGTLHLVMQKKYDSNPALIKLVFASLTFHMALFHKIKGVRKTISEEKTRIIVSKIYDYIKIGLGFTTEKINRLDLEKLEKQIEENMRETEIEPLFKAVAEAVAEAGPWNTSMDMVAKRMGLSKSSLYGHFKNKKDMLRRLFIGEFKRIIEFARQGINMSSDTAQQLYFGIYSITVYLRSRPEILVAMGWIRTRKLDIGKPDKDLEIFRLFEDVKIESMLNAEEDEKQLVSHWILFLLINVLIRPNLAKNVWDDMPFDGNFSKDSVSNNNIRMLYRFITLGLGGFKL
jgi:AcrR family transcriptional regulator